MRAPRKKSAEVKASADEAKLDTFGQITVPLDGQDYVLRPSHEAVESIEAELDRSLFDLAQASARGALKVADMGVIVTELMRAEGKTLAARDPRATDYLGANPEKVAKLIYEAGAPRICARLMVLLSGALNGGYTAEGEAKARTQKE